MVVLDFWATWCPPCREELPTIEKLHLEFKEKDVVFLGINDEDTKTAKAYTEKHSLSFQTGMDTDKSVHRNYAVRAIPTLVVVDRDGRIAAVLVGRRPEPIIRQSLKAAGLCFTRVSPTH